MEGGGIQHFQIKVKFWHYKTNKFDLQAHKQKHMKLSIDIVIKQIYLFNIVAWNYRKKIGFPVCKTEYFRRPSSTPEARKERSRESYSESHI